MNIVQIGTNVACDNLTKIIYDNKKKLNKVILVEPLTFHHGSIEKCYNDIKYMYINSQVGVDDVPKIIIDSSVIVDDINKKEVSFFYHLDDYPSNCVSSLDMLHIKKHSGFNEKFLNDDRYVELKCKSITINQLFDKYNLVDIDILYIDAEGFDDRIIYNIDFNKYNIKEIVYEYIHVDNDKLIKYLEKCGYILSLLDELSYSAIKKIRL